MKEILVQKYGGTSVATVDHMQAIASKLTDAIETHKLVVVVSAMGNTTNLLLEEAKQKHMQTPQEIDAWVSQGENISAQNFQDVLRAQNIPCAIMDAFDIPIETNGAYGSAIIEQINPQKILKKLEKYDVVIVPGFQGVFQKNITTLGRGGSDLTAVALSVCLGAKHCEIYTDVPGVMTTDPKVYERAHILKEISYDQMIALAYAGAKVLQPRCVVLAKRYLMPLIVRSSFQDLPGTTVGKEPNVENMIISGIALQPVLHHITLAYEKNAYRASTEELEKFCTKLVSIQHKKQQVEVQLLLSKEDTKSFRSWAKEKNLPTDQIHENTVAVVTIVGSGLLIQKKLFFEIQNVLFQQEIPLCHSTISDGKIELMVPQTDGAKTVRLLHDYFQLEKEPN